MRRRLDAHGTELDRRGFRASPAEEVPAPVALVEMARRSGLWAKATRLRARGTSPEEEPFTFAWLARLVLTERRHLREIMVASIILSALQILPPLLVMVAIDRVLMHHSMSTLAIIGLMMAILVVYETLTGYARREIVEVMSTRLDTRLNLHVFSRRSNCRSTFNPTAETAHRIAHGSQPPTLS